MAMKLPLCRSPFPVPSHRDRPSRDRAPRGAHAAAGPASSDRPDRKPKGAAARHGPRRCRSARLPSPHPRPGHHQDRPRARSGDPKPPPRRAPVPVPAGDASSKERREGRERREDRDLARMYDRATWSMYERIVSARRARPVLTPTAGRKEDPAAAAARVVDADKAGGGGGDDDGGGGASSESLAGRTADETDRSSDASSSWSRHGSPWTCPSGSGSHGDPATPSRPPWDARDGGEEDAFIFPLDM